MFIQFPRNQIQVCISIIESLPASWNRIYIPYTLQPITLRNIVHNTLIPNIVQIHKVLR